MKRMKWLFQADQEYLDNVHGYTKKDSYLALALYVVDMLLLYALGKIHFHTGKYYGVIAEIVMIAVVVLIGRAKLSSVGISKRGAVPGSVTGLVIGVIFLLSYTIIPGLVRGASFLPVGKILYNVFYYFIIIAFEEELFFRGFLQPRLYALFHREWVTLLVGGILFVLSHYPFQMATRGMGLVEFFPMFIASAPFQLMWHYAFTWLYRRFGNIFGGTILHGFVDMSMGIFG